MRRTTLIRYATSMPNGQYIAQRLQRLQCVEAMTRARRMKSGLTLPSRRSISQSVCLTFPTGEYAGSRSRDRKKWHASEHRPQCTQVST